MFVRYMRVDMRRAVETVLRRLAQSAWCNGCNAIVDLLTFSEAARLAETNSPTLFMWIKAGRVHRVNAQGQQLVCARSIQRAEAVTGKLSAHR